MPLFERRLKINKKVNVTIDYLNEKNTYLRIVRRLTLLGKITIIKSLAVSQTLHVLSSLPSHQGALKEINTLLYDFVWNSKGD